MKMLKRRTLIFLILLVFITGCQNGSEKTAELYLSLFEKAAEILPEIISGFTSGEIKLQKQDESKATYPYS